MNPWVFSIGTSVQSSCLSQEWSEGTGECERDNSLTRRRIFWDIFSLLAMDKANSRLLVARLKHREVIRVSKKTEDLRFPRCWWADNLIIDHEVPFVCSRVPGTMSVEGKFEEKGKSTIESSEGKG